MSAAHTSTDPTTAHAEHDHAHDPHGEHAKYPFLAHHFDSPAQQFDSGKFGMWLFLATEVLFFGGLFVAYAVLRMLHPEVFAYASHYLDTILGGINTLVLIASSFTMAMAVRFAQTNKRIPLIICLLLTLAGAMGFMVIKYFEYTHKIHENLIMGPGFYRPVDAQEATIAMTDPGEPVPVLKLDSSLAPTVTPAAASQNIIGIPLPAMDKTAVVSPLAGPSGVVDLAGTPPAERSQYAEEALREVPTADTPHLLDPKLPVNTHQFFAIYYCMTGLHGIHVIVGIGVISWLVWGAFKGRYNSNYYTPVDLVGLYWHVVDLVWIFLFPLFYLIH